MKFTTERAPFLTALSAVKGRTSEGAIPILQHFRIDTFAGIVKICATDLDACAKTTSAAEVSVRGITCLPADKLYGLVKSLPESAHITIEADETRATLKSGRSRYEMPALPATDFPALLSTDGAEPIGLDAETLNALLDRPQVIMQTKEERPYYQGLWLFVDGGKLASFGSDGTRMCVIRTDRKMPDRKSICIPRGTLAEIAAIGENGCDVSWSDRIFTINNETTSFSTKLIEAVFPDYKRIMPKRKAHYLEVDRLDMLAAARRIQCVAEKLSVADLTWREGQASATLALPGIASGHEEIDCTTHDGLAVHAGIRPSQLIDAMQCFTGERVRFAIYDTSAPFEIYDPADDNTVFVQVASRVAAQEKAAA